jgi:uncharacterized protein YcgI (DUF1989 family)
MSTVSRLTIPARRGKAIRLRQGQHARVINTHGQQVVDTWAFHSTDLHECMSMQHTRAALGHIMVRVGDSCVFRSKVATDSGSILPLIPVEGCH